MAPEEIEIESDKAEDIDAYPIRVKTRHLDDEEATPAQNATSVPNGLFRTSLTHDNTDNLIHKSRGMANSIETIRAKYMIGCDDAHSWTRKQLGFLMAGEQTDYI